MTGAYPYVPAIALLPLAAFVLVGIGGKYMPKKGALAGIGATLGSFALSVWTLLTVVNQNPSYQETLYTFLTGDGAISLHFGVFIDPLSALMLVIVSLISLLVFVFSLGYMNAEGETGLPRYYAEISLFAFSMLAFVFADNLLMAFMFFELVGLCSYLLIGFWFRKPGPASAAKKAFLVTRFGDYFFLVGTVAILSMFGTGMFAGEESFPRLARAAIESGQTFYGLSAEVAITTSGLLVLGGVIGKSAQFPLHTWLPDAMEGPTPISALIHAATMVAAGVYLVARMYGFYALSPGALAVIALIGGFTALLAASMATVKQELKQVLAYSTISQYGYMMLALGGGGYVAGVFHLTTHAIFKALLFLGAGSVIIAMDHTENMWEMGGLKDEMPVTYYMFLSGSLALAGIFPFAGFWSKDEVLYEALIHGLGGQPLLLAGYAMGLLAVVLTGFYTFRMVFLTFHGDPRTETAEDPKDVGWAVKVPLVVLGTLAAIAGVINLAPVEEVSGVHLTFLHDFLNLAPEGTYTSVDYYVEGPLHEYAGYAPAHISSLGPAVVSLGLALAGAGVAYRLYGGRDPDEHTDRLGRLKTLLMNNYYQDEYQVWLARDATVSLASSADTFDQGVIDGVVNAVGGVSLFTSERIRTIQSGVVKRYTTVMTLSLVVLLLVFALLGGWI